MDHDDRHSQVAHEDPASGVNASRPHQERPPRDRIVRSAAQLIRLQGMAASGMREIVTVADAPRGSLQHYFPGGKDQLVGEALAWIGDVAARRARRHLERLGPVTPSRLLEAIVEDWKADLTAEDYLAGCPLVGAAADGASSHEDLRTALRRAFDTWQDALAGGLSDRGVPAAHAHGLAMVTISAVEGAIILSRVRRDLAPLDAVVAELGPVLDAAAVDSGSDG